MNPPMKNISLLVIFCLCAGGCSIPRSVAEGGPTANHRANPASKVLVLSIADGQDLGEGPAHGSGQGLVSAIRKVLVAHGVPLSTTPTWAVAAGLDEARRAGFAYALKGTITLWEDNATAWSGNGDKLTISLDLYDAKTRELVASSTHKRVGTGMTLISGSPDRFMDQVTAGALDKIYGWSELKSAGDVPRHDSTIVPTQSPTDVETMNVELRRLAKESLASGNQKAAKEYLDMIVPESSQH
jgi:hypothetical protein